MSGWQDSNLRPPAPKAGALTGLRYTPSTVIEKPFDSSFLNSGLELQSVGTITTPKSGNQFPRLSGRSEPRFACIMLLQANFNIFCTTYVVLFQFVTEQNVYVIHLSQITALPPWRDALTGLPARMTPVSRALHPEYCHRFEKLPASCCGERGIRTPGTRVGYGSLANCWFQPLTHLS